MRIIVFVLAIILAFMALPSCTMTEPENPEMDLPPEGGGTGREPTDILETETPAEGGPQTEAPAEGARAGNMHAPPRGLRSIYIDASTELIRRDFPIFIPPHVSPEARRFSR
ncbi:MAG: hypothetical protein ACOX7P_06395 [Oscillospiraceae bacterium]|jgi:hypothetical protein